MTRTHRNLSLFGYSLLYSLAIACGSGEAVNTQPPPTSPSIYTISGSIAPGSTAAGAAVVLSGQSSATTTADGSGNYSFTGLSNGSYAITPSKSGYTFSPASLTATVNGANVSGENFTAAANTSQGYSISGSVSANGAGATLALSGASSATITADSSGNYSFTGLANGTYKGDAGQNWIHVHAGNAERSGRMEPTPRQSTSRQPQARRRCLFYDDFTSGTLSADWTILNRPGDASNNELECYTPNNVAIVGGVLQLTAKADSSCQGYNYTSGAVQWTSFNDA